MPFILLFIVLAIGILGDFIPYELKTFLYGISLSVKSAIIFTLPWVIFGLLFKIAAEMVQKATKLLLVIIGSICISNFITSLVGGYIGTIIYGFEYNIVNPEESKNSLEAMFALELPKIIANNVAMILGLSVGILGGKFLPQLAKPLAGFFTNVITKILLMIKYVLPFFVAGFLLKLQHEGMVMMIVKNYGIIFLTILVVASAYLSCWYFVAADFDVRRFIKSIKNMIPACVIGFSSMSSAAAMPMIIEGAAKNSNHPDIAKSVIPIGVNFHLIGCSISIPIMLFAILKNFGVDQPSIWSYLIFSCYFVVAKFSVAAVPGGGIIVMLPIIESCFGFNADMLSLTTALYILFDPVITTCNILGNGCLSTILSRRQL